MIFGLILLEGAPVESRSPSARRQRDRLAFERLQQRLARREAAAAQAAQEWPAHFVAFDLVHRGDDLTGWPYARRRTALEALFTERGLTAPWVLCPSTPPPGPVVHMRGCGCPHSLVLLGVAVEVCHAPNRAISFGLVTVPINASRGEDADVHELPRKKAVKKQPAKKSAAAKKTTKRAAAKKSSGRRPRSA
ncbi:hypothetical protein AB0D40_40875 [Streptomyces massasporeus]|uniref:ATP-dependent DNA ligase n=1 Tax=Streptomyces massasporeus TaxID=67324 RepID=UPI003408504E